MMKDTLLEKYFNNSLNSAESEQLEKLVTTDPEFKEAFEMQQDLKAALIDTKKDQLKTLLQNQENLYKDQDPVLKNNSVLRYLVAALVLVAITVTAFFTLQGGAKSPQELYATNFEPYRNVIAPITRGEEDLNIVEEAFYNYETKQYLKASIQFDTLLANTNESYYLFYKANALLKLGKYKEATHTLKKHQSYKDEFLDKSKWYLALAYLKTNNISESKKILEELVNIEGYNYKKAKKVLKNLK